jgi:hypothetical protein
MCQAALDKTEKGMYNYLPVKCPWWFNRVLKANPIDCSNHGYEAKAVFTRGCIRFARYVGCRDSV